MRRNAVSWSAMRVRSVKYMPYLSPWLAISGILLLAGCDEVQTLPKEPDRQSDQIGDTIKRGKQESAP